MGFQRKRKIYKLDFAETEYEGLVVQVSGLTTGEYLDFLVLSSATPTADANASGNETHTMLEMLARHLVSWNLLDEDEAPVAANFDGVKANDLAMNLRIIDAWIGAISGVPEATEKKSLPGDSPLMVSIPAETLSASLPS